MPVQLHTNRFRGGGRVRVVLVVSWHVIFLVSVCFQRSPQLCQFVSHVTREPLTFGPGTKEHANFNVSQRCHPLPKHAGHAGAAAASIFRSTSGSAAK